MIEVNGALEYVASEDDFIRLVDSYMGKDSANYAAEMLSTNGSELESLRYEVEELKKERDGYYDFYHGMCMDMCNAIEEVIKDILSAKRIDRKKLAERLAEIREEAWKNL